LDRVLGREHMEWSRHVMTVAGDADMQLLHRLQQRRLGARARAVDLVGHEQLSEDRAGDETEVALAARRLLQDLAAHDVGGHQVRRELDAASVKPEHDAHGLDQLGLGEAGEANEQCMAAREHGHHRLLDHPFLSEDHVADRGLGGGDLRPGGLGLAHDHVVELLDHFTAGYRHLMSAGSSTPAPRATAIPHAPSIKVFVWDRVCSGSPGPAWLTNKRATLRPSTPAEPAAGTRILPIASRLRYFPPGAIPPP